MNLICRVCLLFLAMVLQAVNVEGKKGGKGGKGSGGGGSGGSGTMGGIIAGIVAGVIILASMILKYRPYVMKLFGRRSTPRDNKMCVDGTTKDPDLEGNNMKGYPPLDTPIYPTSPPPPVQHNQMDWKRDSYSSPIPQIHPGPPSFPPTPYMGAAYSPAQYSPAQPFPTPYPPPISYSHVQPAPAYGQ